MDAFFASVEQRDFPEYRGRPLAVGGSSDRGVVAAASYEAREYGVRSAMPSKLAIQKCPHIIFAKSRFDVYKEVSKQIREIFFQYTDLVEPLSLDEAYLDVTENKKGLPSATLIAKEIKQKIKETTQLTASAGISFNKFLAKIASDMDKPDGLFLIKPEDADEFIANLPIEKFFGIGKVTADKMRRMGIHKGKDLREKPEIELIKSFGKSGRYYYKISRGEDDRQVKPDRIRKSIGAERTFEEDLSNEGDIMVVTFQIAEMVYERLQKANAFGKTITLKLKDLDFQINSRSKTFKHTITNLEEIKNAANELLHHPHLPQKPLRLIGISISNLDNNNRLGTQLEIDF